MLELMAMTGDSAFEVLAEPHRRRILDLLVERERPVGELVHALELSQPAVSKHLRVLRERGLVEVRVSAQSRIYRVRPEPLRQVDDWLRPYRRLWAERLDDLERHLDSVDAGTSDRPDTGEQKEARP
jgi:DNA-binding transcriptional ArsR family regulator